MPFVLLRAEEEEEEDFVGDLFLYKAILWLIYCL